MSSFSARRRQPERLPRRAATPAPLPRGVPAGSNFAPCTKFESYRNPGGGRRRGASGLAAAVLCERENSRSEPAKQRSSPQLVMRTDMPALEDNKADETPPPNYSDVERAIVMHHNPNYTTCSGTEHFAVPSITKVPVTRTNCRLGDGVEHAADAADEHRYGVSGLGELSAER